MMGTITIQAPASVGESPAQLTLAAGQSATFGVCRCGGCELDLRINDSDVTGRPALAGRITATIRFWLISNLSDAVPVTVGNMDDWYQYLVVEPGRRDMPVPFELAHIDLTASPTGPKIAVFGHEPQYSSGRRPAACGSTDPPLLDPGSTYFSVLRELCRRRLSGAIESGLPTSIEIAKSLRRRYRSMSPRAVDAHIRYVSEKLGMPKGAGREALVSVAIRSNLLSVGAMEG